MSFAPLRPRPVATAPLLAAALVLGPVSAHAGSFSWTRAGGAESCPDREAIAARLAAAMQSPVETALDGRALEAVVAHDGAGWTVSLYWHAADGALAGTRTLREPIALDCGPVADASLASIVMALRTGAIDPPEPLVPAPPPVPTPVPVAPPAPVEPEVPHAHTTRTRGAVMLGGVLAVGWFPATSIGVQLAAELPSWGRFRIGLAATQMAETTVNLQVDGHTASVGLTASEFGADGCGIAARSGAWLELAACGGLRAGVVQAFVYSGSAARGGGQGSFAAEATAIARLAPTGPLVLELTLGARLNITGYDDAGLAGRIQGAVGFVGTLRAGVQFQ